MKAFDRKFGKEFLQALPAGPAVYRFNNAAGELIYVGKAKNLRRRIGQYRNAKRRKRHLKMRSIVKEAAHFEHEPCASDLEACLLEMKLIQEKRPKWNVAGAFHFLYPMIGIKTDLSGTYFCYTTTPDQFPGYEFHGAYRSRLIAGEAFFSLMKLLEHIGHLMPRKQLPRVRYSYCFGFRQLPRDWVAELGAFFRGESRRATEELVLALIEHAAARVRRRETQERLNDLKRFWNHEATPLRLARERIAYAQWPVAQKDRDFLFLRLRHLQEEKRAERRKPESLPIPSNPP